MAEVNDELTKSYRSVLFIGQFLLKSGDLDAFSNSLPKLLTRLGVHDEERRINIIDSFRIVVTDFKSVQNANGNCTELVARTTRNFVRSSLAFFGFLTTVTSVKNLLVNLSRKKLDSSVSLDSFKNIGLISASFGTLLSSVPLTDDVLSKLLPFVKTKHLSTFLTTLAAFQIYPKDYSRDLLSIYLFVYGAENVSNYLIQKGTLKSLKENSRITNLVTKSWFLIPLTWSQLYHTYVVHPEYTPTFAKKVFDSMFRDFNASTLAWYQQDWPLVAETTALIKRATFISDNRVATTVLENDVVQVSSFAMLSSPLRTKFLSIITSDYFKTIFKYAPDKFVKLMIWIVPLYFVKDIITKRISFKELKSKWKSYFTNLLKGSSRLSIFAILSAITAHFLTTQSIGLRPPVKQYRLIGFISGLWGLVFYRNTASKPLLSYILRVTLLSSWKKQAHVYPVLNQHNLDLVLNALGITTLVAFHDSGHGEFLAPKRFNTVAEWISTGGERN